MAARAGFNHKKRLGRTEVVRGTRVDGPDGIPVATRFAIEGAAVIRSLTETDALMVLPDATERVTRGDLVAEPELEPWTRNRDLPIRRLAETRRDRLPRRSGRPAAGTPQREYPRPEVIETVLPRDAIGQPVP